MTANRHARPSSLTQHLQVLHHCALHHLGRCTGVVAGGLMSTSTTAFNVDINAESLHVTHHLDVTQRDVYIQITITIGAGLVVVSIKLVKRLHLDVTAATAATTSAAEL